MDNNSVSAWEKEKGKMTRQALVLYGHYPTRDFVGDDGLEVYDRNIRDTLPGLIEQLNRNDLAAVYEVIKLLVKVPPDGIFVFVERVYGKHRMKA